MHDVPLHGMSRANADCHLIMALMSPEIVYSAASICTGRPSSRSVVDVIGPIDANWIALSIAWGGPALSEVEWGPRPPSRVTKFRTVEELVNVITFGQRLGSFINARSFFC